MNENGWKNVYDELVKEINAIRDIDTSKLTLKIDNNSNIKDIKDDVWWWSFGIYYFLSLLKVS